jgi:hypothetical protein
MIQALNYLAHYFKPGGIGKARKFLQTVFRPKKRTAVTNFNPSQIRTFLRGYGLKGLC